MATVTPHLVVRDVIGAAQWYATALGAVEQNRVELPDAKVMTIELTFGDTTLVITDESAGQGVTSPLTTGSTCCVLQITTDDAVTLWQTARDAGAHIVQPLANSFSGHRHGQILDPFGHRWGISQNQHDTPPDQNNCAHATPSST